MTSKHWPNNSLVAAFSSIGETTRTCWESKNDFMRGRLELWVNSTEASTIKIYLVLTLETPLQQITTSDLLHNSWRTLNIIRLRIRKAIYTYTIQIYLLYRIPTIQSVCYLPLDNTYQSIRKDILFSLYSFRTQ